MKALITALALVTLIATPSFARKAAPASNQTDFVFKDGSRALSVGTNRILSLARLSPLAMV